RALHNAGLIESKKIENSDWDFIADQGSWNNFKTQMMGQHVPVDNPDVQAFKCMHNGKETYFEAYIVRALTSVRELTDELQEEDFTSSYRLLKYAKANIQKDRLSGFYWATPDICLAIKLSHRYLKNNPFFLKTMSHINYLRNKGVVLNDELQKIMLQRQAATLSYSHPKLDVGKKTFLNDTIYTLDHDSIHEAVALADKPAYKFYMKDDSEVMTSREKFEALPDVIKLAGVYEEACVLALERSQVPNEFNISPSVS